MGKRPHSRELLLHMSIISHRCAETSVLSNRVTSVPLAHDCFFFVFFTARLFPHSDLPINFLFVKLNHHLLGLPSPPSSNTRASNLVDNSWRTCDMYCRNCSASCLSRGGSYIYTCPNYISIRRPRLGCVLNGNVLFPRPILPSYCQFIKSESYLVQRPCRVTRHGKVGV